MLFKKEKLDENARPLERLQDHQKAITCMALSDDQSLLVTGSDDGTARMYSAKTPYTECLGVFRYYILIHKFCSFTCHRLTFIYFYFKSFLLGWIISFVRPFRDNVLTPFLFPVVQFTFD
jgi:WD40 repeat protein